VASAGLAANSLSRRRAILLAPLVTVTSAMATSLLYGALLLALAATPSLASSSTVDFTQQGVPFRRGFNGCVGSGHALLGLRSDWRTHLAAVRSDLGVQYIRFHGILDDDMSVIRDDNKGYSFFNTDSVLDYILSLGMLPVVELSFMPRALAARPNETIFHYNGITSPPADWQQFADLIVAFVSHHVARYGLAAVQTWYYEVGHCHCHALIRPSLPPLTPHPSPPPHLLPPRFGMSQIAASGREPKKNTFICTKSLC
jgi:hypothetical protein